MYTYNCMFVWCGGAYKQNKLPWNVNDRLRKTIFKKNMSSLSWSASLLQYKQQDESKMAGGCRGWTGLTGHSGV